MKIRKAERITVRMYARSESGKLIGYWGSKVFIPIKINPSALKPLAQTFNQGETE
jgi:hypothetical protein